MDSASAFGAEGSGFESQVDRPIIFYHILVANNTVTINDYLYLNK